MIDRLRSTDRRSVALFLAGPVIWFAHFMGVYVVVEASCVAGGTSIDIAGLPLLSAFTLAATVVALVAVLYATVLAARAWRREHSDDDVFSGGEGGGGLLLGGVILGLVFAVSILFVGLPALFLEPCLPS